MHRYSELLLILQGLTGKGTQSPLRWIPQVFWGFSSLDRRLGHGKAGWGGRHDLLTRSWNMYAEQFPSLARGLMRNRASFQQGGLDGTSA